MSSFAGWTISEHIHCNLALTYATAFVVLEATSAWYTRLKYCNRAFANDLAHCRGLDVVACGIARPPNLIDAINA
jgi:hypothetical protein